MSNITESLNQRIFVIPRANFTTDSQKELISLILERHGEKFFNKIKLIDENDDYDSFFVEIVDRAFCIKISFDNIPIFYDFMILKGIEHLNISPYAFDRSQISFGKDVYYTIQSYEYSENLFSMGPSSIFEDYNSNLFSCLKKMHTYEPPKEVWPHLDDTQSYLEYHNTNFKKISEYIDASEVQEFNFIKFLYEEVFNEMFNYFLENKKNLTQEKFVHGNLDTSTIIANNGNFKFINFENSFVGNPFFDITNIAFELQMNGLKEYDFVTKRIEDYELCENRFKSKDFLNEYKICKHIWIRKKLLDLINEYIKEVLILNKTRTEKMYKIGHYFSSNFYKFDEIKVFNKNRDKIVNKFKSIILDA